MIGPALVRARFSHVSGLPEDVTVHDFAFVSGGTLANLTFAVDTFLNVAVVALGGPITAFYSGVVSRALLAHRYDVYLLDTPAKLGGGPLGSPVLSVPFTSSAGGAGAKNLPSEVALCMSFRANYGADVEDVPLPPAGPAGDEHPRARKRGRVYLGPFTTDMYGGGGVELAVRPSSSFQDLVLAAGVRLRDSIDTAWGVWSRKNASVEAVDVVSVDNAFDTVRARGERASARITNP